MRSMRIGDFAPRTYACTALAVFFNPKQDLYRHCYSPWNNDWKQCSKNIWKFHYESFAGLWSSGVGIRISIAFTSSHSTYFWHGCHPLMSQHMRRTEMRHLEGGPIAHIELVVHLQTWANHKDQVKGALSQASRQSLAFCIEYSEALSVLYILYYFVLWHCSRDVLHKMLTSNAWMTSILSGFLLSQATAPLLSTKTSGSFQQSWSPPSNVPKQLILGPEETLTKLMQKN